MFDKALVFIFFLGKTVSQDVSQSNRQCIDNPTGALNVDVRGVPGPEGPRGERGPKGSTGETGVKGDPGMKGDRGLPGDTGPIGTTGNKGETGRKGQKGSCGIQGHIGPTGRPGLPGPQGIQGEPGDTVLNREEFDRVCEATAKKLNESIIAELVKDNKQFKEQVNFLVLQQTRTLVEDNKKLNERVWYLEQQHGIKTLCNITSFNWRRIAYFDTTRGDPCPSGLHTSTNTTSGQRACGTTKGQRSQLSLKFSTGGNYTNVCGRVRGYSGGKVLAFHPYIQHGRSTIDTSYADGVLITRGSPRQHLWTNVAGLSEYPYNTRFVCPCARSGYNTSWIPSFVGSNYYCESGLVTNRNVNVIGKIWWDDPLWDGKGCFTSGNTCCDRYGWFHRQVPPTTDDIEVRWSKEFRAILLTDQLEIWVM